MTLFADLEAAQPFLVVLGIAQDGGYPQAGCRDACCAPAWEDPAHRRHVACIGIVDPATSERWLVDATPDFREQLRMLDTVAPAASVPGLSGILLTHGHMGHYTGLLHLGREVIGSRAVPVYAMPRMFEFLRANGPWDQLVGGGHIELRVMCAGESVPLNDRLAAVPLPVPHRSEFTETVGFRIAGPRRAALFIPDTDGWERWDRSLEAEIAAVDVAYLDGSFQSDAEVPGRDLSEIPHPFIVDTVDRLRDLSAAERSKVRFIHLNHTNPLLRPDGPQRTQVEKAGFRVADEMELMSL